MNRLLMGFSVVLFSTSAFSIIDMKNANYSETYSLLDIPGAGFNLSVVATYNSRSLHNGIFGFGWCSNFETSISVEKDGAPISKECGDGLQTTFRPKSLTTKVAKLEKVRDMKDGVVYANQGVGSETLVRKNDVIVRTLNNGVVQRYDLDGNLIGLQDKNGNTLKFTIKGNQILDAVDNNGRKLTFKYYSNTQKVKEIVGPNKTSVSFEYKNVSDLSTAIAAGGSQFSFEYDDLHNMTKVTFPDKSSKQLTYDKNRDWVTSLVDRDKCTEKYEYTSAKIDPKNHYWSNVVKTCDGKVTNKSRYEFWYKVRKETGDKFLERVAMDVNGDKTDITYHPVFGRPLILKRNNLTTKYTYLANGLVKTRAQGKQVTEYDYDSANRVKSVKIGKRKTDFAYDDRGNLKKAVSSSGQYVYLEWDKNGRISELEDQAKRKIHVMYDEKFSKPKFVERVGMGTLSIKYKNDGEVDKVESDGGPVVASQIASAFNGMIELTSPAGVELGF